jgi:hypothetical protein
MTVEMHLGFLVDDHYQRDLRNRPEATKYGAISVRLETDGYVRRPGCIHTSASSKGWRAAALMLDMSILSTSLSMMAVEALSANNTGLRLCSEL